MGIGAFTDKRLPPSPDQILAVVGSRRAVWDELIVFMRDTYHARDELKFYSKDLGWAVRFSKGSTALLSLYPAKDSITAQVVLGPSLIEKALALSLGEKVRRLLEEAHQYPEGRWLFVKIESADDVRDVQQLLSIKARPARSGGDH